MDITTGAREKGVYAIRTVGMQHWREGDSTWRAHGVRLVLMDGTIQLAVCTIEVPGTLAAEERGEQEATAIEPWVRTMQYLHVTRRLRGDLDAARRLLEDAAAHAEMGGTLDQFEEETLRGLASDQEIADTVASTRREPVLGMVVETPAAEVDQALAAAVVRRLTAQVDKGLRAAFAHAPDPAEHPIHPAWQTPGLSHSPGKSLATELARDVLAGWAAARDRRDPLITWAVQEAEVTRTEVQQVTGVSRSTINRLLPEVAGDARTA